MLNVDATAVNMFVDYYMPIFDAIYTVVRNLWYVYNPQENKFIIKTHGKKLEVNFDNYQELFLKRYKIAEEWQEWYYQEFNDEVEENASSNGKR